MKVKVEEAGPCRKTLRVEMPAERVSGEYQKALAEYAKFARIDGFRPGKAPRQLVERHFQKDIEQTLKDRLIPAGYEEALQQEKIDPVAVLGVHDVSFLMGHPLSFSVTLDVPPKFDLPKYQGIPLEGKKAEVADKDIEEAIAHLREQNARWDEVSGRPVQRGDLVQIDYEGFCEGKGVEELAPKAAGLGKGKDFWMLADENAFLPELSDGLVGANLGEKKQILVDFKADFPEPAVAGKKCTYFVDVKGLREKKLPAADQSLFEALKVDSEDALKAKVREDLLHAKEDMEKRRLKSEIVKHLLANTKLDVPASIVEEETRETVYDIVRENSYRGVSREDIESKKDEIFQVASRNAVEKVKARYILHRIAEEEKIAASEEDLAARVAEMAARYNIPPPSLREELARRGTLDNIAEEIRVQRSLDFLLEKAVVKT
ncbi:MAG: trigger factor [Verrucomicrobiota bacterium]